MLAILGTVLLVTVPKGSDSGPTGGCLEKIASDALKAGSLRNLDPTCVQAIPGPKFLTGDERRRSSVISYADAVLPSNTTAERAMTTPAVSAAVSFSPKKTTPMQTRSNALATA